MTTDTQPQRVVRRSRSRLPRQFLSAVPHELRHLLERDSYAHGQE